MSNHEDARYDYHHHSDWPAMICTWPTCCNETRGGDSPYCQRHNQIRHEGKPLADIEKPRYKAGHCDIEALENRPHGTPPGGSRYCRDCRAERAQRSRDKAMEQPGLEPIELTRLRAMCQDTHAYILSRRKRGIPAEGVKQWTTT